MASFQLPKQDPRVSVTIEIALEGMSHRVQNLVLGNGGARVTSDRRPSEEELVRRFRYRRVLEFSGQHTTLKEVAARMGRSHAAVRQLYGRALARYGAILDELRGVDRE